MAPLSKHEVNALGTIALVFLWYVAITLISP